MEKTGNMKGKTTDEKINEIYSVLVTDPLHGEGLVDQVKRHEKTIGGNFQ